MEKQELLKIEAAINAEEAKRSFLRDRGYTDAQINSTLPGIGLTGSPLGNLAAQNTTDKQANALQLELSRVEQKIAQTICVIDANTI